MSFATTGSKKKKRMDINYKSIFCTVAAENTFEFSTHLILDPNFLTIKGPTELYYFALVDAIVLNRSGGQWQHSLKTDLPN